MFSMKEKSHNRIYAQRFKLEKNCNEIIIISIVFRLLEMVFVNIFSRFILFRILEIPSLSLINHSLLIERESRSEQFFDMSILILHSTNDSLNLLFRMLISPFTVREIFEFLIKKVDQNELYDQSQSWALAHGK